MTSTGQLAKPIEILLVEDSRTDADLTLRALKQGGVVNNVHHVTDGQEALDYLRRSEKYHDATRPDLILLDLNMPRMDGRELLREMRGDESLKALLVVVLATSDADKDILESYGLHANAYIVKPVDLHKFFQVTRDLKHFWFQVVKLPPND
jgi:CheY-like chemotaxis protein